MTTNRMGLEQTLSDEQLSEALTGLERNAKYYALQPGGAEQNVARIMLMASKAVQELQEHRQGAGTPVARIVQAEEYDGASELTHKRDIDYYQEDIDELPVGTHLYTAQPLRAGTVPDGWVMVPKEPTEDMVISGFESEPDQDFSNPDEWEAYNAMSGCQQAAHKARLCWATMIAAAPKLTNEP